MFLMIPYVKKTPVGQGKTTGMPRGAGEPRGSQLGTPRGRQGRAREDKGDAKGAQGEANTVGRELQMNLKRFQRQRVFELVRSNALKIKSEEETFPCLSQTGESASSFLTHAPCRGLPSLPPCAHPGPLSWALLSTPWVLSGTLGIPLCKEM